MKEPSRLQGGCHCGAVRFVVRIDRWVGVDCNCSICTKKGFLHHVVDAEAFELLSGNDDLLTYSFGTHTAKHHFCRHCGIHSFYIPRSKPDGFSVNLRCLDEGFEQFTIQPFDGQHWEEHIEALRASR